MLIADGWTIENFSCAASDEKSLDEIWTELVPDADLSLLQKAALRAAYKRCRAKMDPSGPLASAEPSATGETPSSNSSWSESFAPKLDSAKITELKEKIHILLPIGDCESRNDAKY